MAAPMIDRSMLKLDLSRLRRPYVDPSPPQASEQARPPTPTEEVMRHLEASGGSDDFSSDDASSDGEQEHDRAGSSDCEASESEGESDDRPVGHTSSAMSASEQSSNEDIDDVITSAGRKDSMKGMPQMPYYAHAPITAHGVKTKGPSEADEILELKRLLGHGQPRRPQAWGVPMS